MASGGGGAGRERAMNPATYTHKASTPRVVHLRVGRLLLLAFLVLLAMAAVAFWLLSRPRPPSSQPLPEAMTTNPAWMKQATAYLPEDPFQVKAAVAAPPPTPDRSEEVLQGLSLLRKESQATQAALAKMQQDSHALRQDVEALKQRPAPLPPPRTPPPPPAPAKAPTPPRPAGGMLFISHDLKEVPPPPARPEYTLAPGATKIPFILETKIISDVEGYLTGRVSVNIYDTATGRHLLIPQGSTVLGNTQSSKLIYGNERLDTITLKLALPDGRSVDLERAPITDQEGVAGLGGDVNSHYGRLLAAVLIQGVLRGGTQAISTAVAGAAGAEVITGVSSSGSQTATTVTGPLLSTKPTITTEAGQLANIILLKELRLPEMWATGEPRDPAQAKKR
jgi:type IV secretion system protein TrbI